MAENTTFNVVDFSNDLGSFQYNIFSNMFHIALYAYVKQIINIDSFTLKIISEENVSPKVMEDDIRYSADGRITVPTVGIGRKWVSAVMADIIGDL